MRIPVMLFAALVAGSAEAAAPKPPSELARAKAALERTLIDPTAVLYRDVVIKPGLGVCGQYNAKNRMGGYSGFDDFAWLAATSEIIDSSAYAPAEDVIRKALIFRKLGCDAGLGTFSDPDFLRRYNVERAKIGKPPVPVE